VAAVAASVHRRACTHLDVIPTTDGRALVMAMCRTAPPGQARPAPTTRVEPKSRRYQPMKDMNILTKTPLPPTTPRPGFAGATVRRWTCGVALIMFPALLVVQAVIDPATGGTGDVMYTAATVHRGALLGAAALLIVSGVLMVPAATAITHQARDRGAWLANVGALTAVLGGIGHVGIGFFYVMAAALPGGERGEMTGYIERLNGSTALAVMVFPLISCFTLGVLLLPWAAFRAGQSGWWAPVLATVAVLQHVALPPEFPAQEAINTAAICLLTVVFSHFGIRVLRMSDSAWVAPAGR
jgi:hypothetical protein